MRATLGCVVLCAWALAACGDDENLFPGAGGAATTGGPGAGGAGATGAGATGGEPAGGSGGEGEGGAGGGGGAGGTEPIPSRGCRSGTARAGDADFTTDHDGEPREYRVHAPPDYDGSAPLPMVLVFHGYTETNDQIETITQMTPETDARGYIVVYPQGRFTSWNAGSCCGSSSILGVDDVGFAMQMLDEIEAAYCVDTSRVFSAGFSAGGMLSHRLACEHAERIAAIGPVSGAMGIDTCEPSRPVPVMHFHGTSDFVVPYEGGGIPGGDSASATVADWAARNGCTRRPATTFDRGDAHCETYDGCTDDAVATLCTLEGGGHQWPGGESAGPGGEINMDIFASTALLDFFDAHPMP